MKKTIKLALVAAMALGTTSAFATNGSNLIGIGAKARSMGGAAIGIAHGAQSGLSNPALITKIDTEFETSFGGTIFMPDVKNQNQMNFGPMGNITSSGESDANMNVIPNVGIAAKITDELYMGIGMWGTAGMGTDYDGAGNKGQMQMSTTLQLMQFGVPIAYETSGFSIGITPLLQYGSLDIDYVMPSEMQGAMYYQKTGTPPTPGMFHPEGIGHGSQQDLKFGYNIGLAYKIDGLTLGAVYKSQIDMKYDGVLEKTMSPMSAIPYTNDELSTPEEIGLGISYNLGNHTIALDYKRINWSDAKGYEDFDWQDQNVFIIGYQYETDKWALRAGFNYAKSPIEEKSLTYMNSAGLSGGVVNTMNLLGFPAITESHYTLGGSYVFSEKVSVDLAMMYAPEQEETYMNFVGQAIHTSHSQTSASLALNYKF